MKYYPHTYIKLLARILVYFFAVIGLIFVLGYIVIRLGLTDTSGIIDEQKENFLQTAHSTPWKNTEEWSVMSIAIKNDWPVILKASKDSGSDPRLIASIVAVEQLRLFTDNRELFKSYFAPLKILGSQVQFSWGVMGIKEDTAIMIEKNLKDSASPFYLGKGYENILDFKTNDVENERFQRIINEKDHYYAYLYAGFYLSQIEKQWKDAGFNISNRPEILSTLYNIGFTNSHPNADPKSGGSEMTFGNSLYSFGRLTADIYSSGVFDSF